MEEVDSVALGGVSVEFLLDVEVVYNHDVSCIVILLGRRRVLLCVVLLHVGRSARLEVVLLVLRRRLRLLLLRGLLHN